MTLFADMDPATVALYSAITGLLIALGNYIQYAAKDWKDARVAKEKKEADDLAAAEKAAADKKALEETAAKLAKTTKETAATLADKQDATAHAITQTVNKAMNGEGLGGKLDAVIAEQKRQGEWQKAHDAQDNQRHDDMIARVLGLKGKPEG